MPKSANRFGVACWRFFRLALTIGLLAVTIRANAVSANDDALWCPRLVTPAIMQEIPRSGWERFGSLGAYAPRLRLENVFWGSPGLFLNWLAMRLNTDRPVFERTAIAKNIEAVREFFKQQNRPEKRTEQMA